MTNQKNSVLPAFLHLAVPFFLFLTPLQVSDSLAQADAREILRKAAKAAGVLDRSEAIRNYQIKTESEIHLPSGRIDITVTEIIELPDKTRQTIDLKGGRRVQVLDGNAGWTRVGQQKNALNALEMREMQRGLFRDLVHLYVRCEDPDLTMEFIGDENMDGKQVRVIRIKNVSGDFVYLYIDAESASVIKKTYRGGSEVGLALLQEVYSDYVEFDGVLLPLITRVTANGKLFMQSKILQAIFNLSLEKDVFLD